MAAGPGWAPGQWTPDMEMASVPGLTEATTPSRRWLIQRPSIGPDDLTCKTVDAGGRCGLRLRTHAAGEPTAWMGRGKG